MILPSFLKIRGQRQCRRQQEARASEDAAHMELLFLLYAAAALVYVGDDEYNIYGGNKMQEMHRRRKDLEKDIFVPLGSSFIRRSYRMSKESFYRLHSILQPQLEQHFFPKQGGKRCHKKNPYLIKTETRLSVAIRIFAGGSPYDVMLTHGISFTSIFTSLWGVVECINKCTELAFQFPTHDEQKKIAKGFQNRSFAGFDCVVGAIDGILIWTKKPSLNECRQMKCGESQFKCTRKDKFGLNMQAICDHDLKFLWVDLNWPGVASDFMAWCTSSLCQDLENNTESNILLPGMTLVGDSAYVKASHMAVPVKGGELDGFSDAYNFYQSQLRITIERAFGVLVHRWSILRAPLLFPIAKVPPLVVCLCRLHNFCIDDDKNQHSEQSSPEMNAEDVANIQRHIRHSNHENRRHQRRDHGIVRFDIDANPVSLLDGGSHFTDCTRQIPTQNECAMDRMLKRVEDMGLTRPVVHDRRNI